MLQRVTHLLANDELKQMYKFRLFPGKLSTYGKTDLKKKFERDRRSKGPGVRQLQRMKLRVYNQ